eukprot:scaffold323059_cov14-Tisochrysis_lutea.AAC.1
MEVKNQPFWHPLCKIFAEDGKDSTPRKLIQQNAMGDLEWAIGGQKWSQGQELRQSCECALPDFAEFKILFSVLGVYTGFYVEKVYTCAILESKMLQRARNWS